MTVINNELRAYLQSLVQEEISDWELLESKLSLKKISKGDHFFQHYDKCTDLALVSEGIFRIYLTDEEGEEKTFSFISEKEFILDFFLSWSSAPSLVSVQALEDSEVYTININDFKEIMAKSNNWSILYKEVLIRNYMRKTKREIQFVLHNAKARLREFIQSKSAHFDRIPKSYLASYLGIAPPSLSRLLREFKEELEPKEDNEL